MNTYGLKISLALAVVVGPALQSYLHFGTVDTYPYVLTLAMGAVISALLAVMARRNSRGIVPVGTSHLDTAFELRQANWCIRCLGPPLWTFTVALAANRLFDDSPTVDHEVRLLNFATRSKGPSTMHVESWRHAGRTETLRYDWRTMSAISSATRARQMLVVSTRTGAFGWEWVPRVRQAPQ